MSKSILLALILIFQPSLQFGLYNKYSRNQCFYKADIYESKIPKKSSIKQEDFIDFKRITGTIQGTFDINLEDKMFIEFEIASKEIGDLTFKTSRKLKFDIWLPKENFGKEIVITSNENYDENLRIKDDFNISSFEDFNGYFTRDELAANLLQANLLIDVQEIEYNLGAKNTLFSQKAQNFIPTIKKFDLIYEEKGTIYRLKFQNFKVFFHYDFFYYVFGIVLGHLIRAIITILTINGFFKYINFEIDIVKNKGSAFANFFIWVGFFKIFLGKITTGISFVIAHNFLDPERIIFTKFILFFFVYLFQSDNKYHDFFKEKSSIFLLIICCGYSLLCFFSLEFVMYSPIFKILVSLSDIKDVKWNKFRDRKAINYQFYNIFWVIAETIFLTTFSLSTYKVNYGIDEVTFMKYFLPLTISIFVYSLVIYCKITSGAGGKELKYEMEFISTNSFADSKTSSNIYCPIRNSSKITNEKLGNLVMFYGRDSSFFIQNHVRIGGNYFFDPKFKSIEYYPHLDIFNNSNSKWKFFLDHNKKEEEENLGEKKIFLINEVFHWNKKTHSRNLIGIYYLENKGLKIMSLRRRKVIFSFKYFDFPDNKGSFIKHEEPEKPCGGFLRINKDRSISANIFFSSISGKFKFRKFSYKVINNTNNLKFEESNSPVEFGEFIFRTLEDFTVNQNNEIFSVFEGKWEDEGPLTKIMLKMKQELKEEKEYLVFEEDYTWIYDKYFSLSPILKTFYKLDSFMIVGVENGILTAVKIEPKSTIKIFKSLHQIDFLYNFIKFDIIEEPKILVVFHGREDFEEISLYSLECKIIESIHEDEEGEEEFYLDPGFGAYEMMELMSGDIYQGSHNQGLLEHGEAADHGHHVAYYDNDDEDNGDDDYDDS